MFGKGHFEGQYRTKPVVSIRGASKYETKKELLERAHQERANREVIVFFVSMLDGFSKFSANCRSMIILKKLLSDSYIPM